jgi:uncharacterized protein (UPF0264 family)
MPRTRRAPGLIVSVRSPQEAESALTGGADIIDVKEPDHGPLGRASDQTILAVLDHVAGRRPVSAALGELAEQRPPVHDSRLAFVKWGLAGCGSSLRPRTFEQDCFWQTKLKNKLSQPGSPHTVIVAYADWQCAQAPTITEIVDFACQKPGNVVLIDTHCKEPDTLRKDHRPHLLDWISVNELRDLCAQCHGAGVRVALAGSLTFAMIELLRCAEPDWFAVRGAVCSGANRLGTVEADRVAELVKRLAS